MRGSANRREALGGLLASAAAMGAARAPTSWVDVHAHLFPPELMRAAPKTAAALTSNPAVMAASPDQALDDMARAGIGHSVLSFPQPAMWPHEPAAQRELAAVTNDYYSGLARRYPARFSFFASLPPLIDAEGAIAEIDRALALPGAQGVRIMTSYGDRWLGAPEFRPVWQALEARGAVVFIHPEIPSCCASLAGVPPGYAELPLDTARTVTSLWYSGGLERLKKARLLLSHGGGALPMIAGRLSGFGRPAGGSPAAMAHDALQAFRALYVDTANATSGPSLAAARALVGDDHVLFGSDAPFVPRAPQAAALRAALRGGPALERIAADNARRLLPRLAGAPGRSAAA